MIDSGNVSLALKQLIVAWSNVCKMDNHPSCRRLHKIPAHTFKDRGKWPQRRSRVLRSFLRSEPPIIAGFSASSTPFFKAASPGWTLLPMPLRRWTRRPFVVASRLLWQAFQLCQQLVWGTWSSLWSCCRKSRSKPGACKKRKTPLRMQRGSRV